MIPRGGMRLAATAMVTVLTLAVSAACDSQPKVGPGPKGEDALDRAMDVANDAHATAKEIIAAGGAVDITVSGDRRVIVYKVRDFAYGEGSTQAAWRLYDKDGHRVTEGKLHLVNSFVVPPTYPVDDGFLIAGGRKTRWLHVARDGSRAEVPQSKAPVMSRAGDLLLGILGDRIPSLYRPDPDGGVGQVLRLHRIPGSLHETFAGLASDGAVWQQVDRGRWSAEGFIPDPGPPMVSRSADGAAPWVNERIPVPSGFVAEHGLTVIGDRLFLFCSDHTKVGHKVTVVHTLLERSTKPTGSWRRIDLSGIEISTHLNQPKVTVLPDGRLSLRGVNGELYVQDGDGFRAIDTAGGFAEDLKVTGNDLYWYRGDTSNMSVSHDMGNTWEYLPR